jgi:hypothetical protein
MDDGVWLRVLRYGFKPTVGEVNRGKERNKREVCETRDLRGERSVDRVKWGGSGIDLHVW